MLHSLLFAPFADPACQAQYDAVLEALQAEAHPGTTVLLGNFLLAEEPIDAVVVRRHGITALLFVPGSGQLSLPSLDGPWLLDGKPLAEEALANPFARFRRQQPVLADWLGTDLSARPIPAPALTAVVLFAAPVTFDATMEPRLRQQPGADGFQLLRHPAHLPRRLQQLTRAEIELSEEALQGWVRELATDMPTRVFEEDVVEEVSELVAPMGFWEHKARQLWHWLGAEDIPADRPYGYPAEDAEAAGRAEQRRLAQIRQQVREEVQAQQHAAAAREAARDQLIQDLQTQLRAASAMAPETQALQQRLAVEMQEKAALQEAVRAAQSEAAVRNQLLDSRIEQLGTLMQQLQARPASPAVQHPAPAPGPVAPVPPAAPAAARPPRRAAAARPAAGWQLQWHRVAVVAALAGGLGWGVWGVLHLASKLTSGPPTSRSTSAKPRPAPATPAAAAAPDADQYQPDSVGTDAEPEPSAAVLDSAEVPAGPVDSAEVMPEVDEPELDDTAPN
ncbi:hypothetical protein E5K00_03755 [Hymenobacter aquaticus]|uniref:NERD domain-containing protein n=1 Tax=Hymenobacter aquaticus TaxID=1867101 RepID=A0A4Z0Q5J3_9BACT|nr:hypothetical protein [Hymenobacter aquaticus]TGE24341.1 hypothetical protein E5K00_03755 [Hymenobacter aquaticus]